MLQTWQGTSSRMLTSFSFPQLMAYMRIQALPLLELDAPLMSGELLFRVKATQSLTLLCVAYVLTLEVGLKWQGRRCGLPVHSAQSILGTTAIRRNMYSVWLHLHHIRPVC